MHYIDGFVVIYFECYFIDTQHNFQTKVQYGCYVFKPNEDW